MIARSEGAVHIVGIAGCATSGLGRLLRARGRHVSGSDAGNPEVVAELAREGFQVSASHAEENLPEDASVVVHSAAIPAGNPELVAARARGVPVRKLAEFLGDLTRDEATLAVAGTHGKTTTAAMVASIFAEGDRDPSVLIGGEHAALGGNWRHGSGDEFIVEACEYDHSFLSLRPAAGIVTTLELDHPEIYGDEEELLDAFTLFLGGFRAGGPVVVPGDGGLADRLGAPAEGARITFGFGPRCDWRAVAIRSGPEPRFEVVHGVRRWGRVKLGVPGRYNVANAVAAVALAAELGVERDAILSALANFRGVRRRFDVRGTESGVTLVDDYAHHPTEIRCTLGAAREVFPERRIWAVFQPHQLGRVQAFEEEFSASFSDADVVMALPTYSVRERPEDYPPGLEDRLWSDVAGRHPDVRRAESPTTALAQLGAELREGDVCLLLGAGDVVDLTEPLRQELRSRGATT